MKITVWDRIWSALSGVLIVQGDLETFPGLEPDDDPLGGGVGRKVRPILLEILQHLSNLLLTEGALIEERDGFQVQRLENAVVEAGAVEDGEGADPLFVSALDPIAPPFPVMPSRKQVEDEGAGVVPHPSREAEVVALRGEPASATAGPNMELGGWELAVRTDVRPLDDEHASGKGQGLCRRAPRMHSDADTRVGAIDLLCDLDVTEQAWDFPPLDVFTGGSGRVDHHFSSENGGTR